MADGRRADARRNETALLAAAKIEFARAGVDVPAKQITDRAGLGVGTLYRHFPRRSDLVVAVLEHDIDSCAAAASQPSPDAWTALVVWIGRLGELVGAKRGFAAALHSGDAAFAGLPAYFFAALEDPAATLLTNARQSGDLRDDITARDLLSAVALLCHPVPGETSLFNERMLGIFTDGLRSG